MNSYLGHETQLARVEEHRLVGGKGDGMRLFEMNNGRGLQLTVSADRCADISRLAFRGVNMSYFSPCGYVSPTYYDCVGTGFLKSFTAGFLTTSGLQSVGNPCTDQGEALPLHGSIANTPAEHVLWSKNEKVLRLEADVNDEGMFTRKLRLHRCIEVYLDKNEFSVTDEIMNEGDTRTPVELLYHMNMGYPLLDEDSLVYISSESVSPRNEHAAEDIANWMHMEKPQPGYEERCYYHTCHRKGIAAIYQPELGQGLAIHYDPAVLDCFTEWKMMGVRDYVLGLEPGNCYPDGRDVMREKGILKYAEPGTSLKYSVKVHMLTSETEFFQLKE